MTLAAIDTGALVDVVVNSLLAGIGVTSVFALAILGATKVADMGRDGRPLEAALYGALALVSLAACAGAVVLGIVFMTSK